MTKIQKAFWFTYENTWVPLLKALKTSHVNHICFQGEYLTLAEFYSIAYISGYCKYYFTNKEGCTKCPIKVCYEEKYYKDFEKVLVNCNTKDKIKRKEYKNKGSLLLISIILKYAQQAKVVKGIKIY